MKLTLHLAILAAANLLAAFLIQALVFIILGPGEATDALFAAVSLPQLVVTVVAGSLMQVLVPLFTGRSEEDQRREAWSAAALITAVFTLIAGALAVFADVWVAWLVPGFDPEVTELTVRLTRIQLPCLVLSPLAGLLWAVHHTRRRFIRPELALLASTAAGLALLAWGLPRYGVEAGAWVHTIRVAGHTLLLLPSLGRPARPNLRSPLIREAVRRVVPLLAGASAVRLGPLVDRVLSSLTPAGGLSLLYFAQQLTWGAHTIITKSLTAPLLPELSERARQGSEASLRSLLRRRLLVTALVSSGAFLVLLTAGPGILTVFIGHGSVDSDNVGALWVLCVALGGSLVFGPLEQTLAFAYYARGNTITPTRVGIVAFLTATAGKILGFRWLGLPGIAIGVSLHALTSCALLWVLLSLSRPRTGGRGDRHGAPARDAPFPSGPPRL